MMEEVAQTVALPQVSTHIQTHTKKNSKELKVAKLGL